MIGKYMHIAQYCVLGQTGVRNEAYEPEVGFQMRIQG